jgi:hypothetical protein
MPATFILTTPDAELAKDWARQLPVPPLAALRGDLLLRELQRPGARVWIRDISDPEAQGPAHPDTAVIAVGEPQSLPFEEARQSRLNTYCLSYVESRTQLRRLAPLAAELAQMRAVLTVLQGRPRRADSAATDTVEAGRRALDDFEFMAAAIDHLRDRERVIEEFRRGARSRIRSSKVVVFLRDEKRYVAVNEGWECPANHDLVRWLQEHAAIVESSTLDSVENPVIEASIRQKLGEWNSRLLVPLEADGALDGWVSFGPRADGRPYSTLDRDDALMLVQMLSRLLGQHKLLHSAIAAQRDVGFVRKYGPRFCVIGASGKTDETLPVEVREIASLTLREGRRIEREFGRIRVTAGPIPETGGCWVWWDESELTAESSAQKREAERHQILNDLGIMISHELANAMLSVSTYFHHFPRQRQSDDPGYPLIERVRQDLERMKAMPNLLSTLYEMSKQPAENVDLKQVVESVADEIGGRAHTPKEAPVIWGHGKNLHDALMWLCREIIETRDPTEPLSRDQRITITLQQRGRDDEAICLITIAYPGLRVDQIKVGEATTTGEYPTVPVFLAREVIRFHYGTVHVGQGIEGTELMISVRSRRVHAIAEVAPGAHKQPATGETTRFEPLGRAVSGDPEALPESA